MAHGFTTESEREREVKPAINNNVKTGMLFGCSHFPFASHCGAKSIFHPLSLPHFSSMCRSRTFARVFRSHSSVYIHASAFVSLSLFSHFFSTFKQKFFRLPRLVVCMNGRVIRTSLATRTHSYCPSLAPTSAFLNLHTDECF